MPLLYRGLRHLLRLGLELYFLEVETSGEVPREGPLVLAANHPNSIMDAVVLGTKVPRPISFLARSGLFRNPVAAALFRSSGVVPVYRRQDGTAPEGANDDAFRACHELLERGGAIGIFPEGRNAPERHVRDIKTGVARIALGAEAQHGFGLGVRIVPVGLNFQDRDAFLTRVLVRFGEPIEVRDHREAWLHDEHEAVRALTDRVQEAMRAQAVHIRDARNTRLVSDLHEIYAGDLLAQPAGERDAGLDAWFSAKQSLVDAFERLEAEEPEVAHRIRRRVRRHEEHLSQLRLKRDFAERPPAGLSVRREALKMTLYALLLAPVALWGLLHGFVPYRVTRRLALRAPDEAIRAITAFLAGALVFGMLYVLLGWAVWAASGSPWWGLAYVATLPPSGLFYLRWRRQLTRHARRIVVRTLFLNDRKLLRRLLIQREQLLVEVEAVTTRRGGGPVGRSAGEGLREGL